MPLDAGALQLELHEIVARAGGRDDDMLLAPVDPRRHAAADAGVILAHHAGKALNEELLLIEAGLQLRHEPHGEV